MHGRCDLKKLNGFKKKKKLQPKRSVHVPGIASSTGSWAAPKWLPPTGVLGETLQLHADSSPVLPSPAGSAV